MVKAKKRWTKKKITQYVNDIVEYMDTCKNTRCIHQEEGGCTRHYIALEYGMDLKDLAKMGNDWKDADFQKLGDKFCLSAYYPNEESELSEEEKALADKIENSLKGLR